MVDSMAAREPGRMAMVHVDLTPTCAANMICLLFRTVEPPGQCADSAWHRSRRQSHDHSASSGWNSGPPCLPCTKLGALGVPSPALLTAKDISYRVNFASIKGAIVDTSVSATVEAAQADCPSLTVLVQAGLHKSGGIWRVLKYGRRCASISASGRCRLQGKIRQPSIFPPVPPVIRRWSCTISITRSGTS